MVRARIEIRERPHQVVVPLIGKDAPRAGEAGEDAARAGQSLEVILAEEVAERAVKHLQLATLVAIKNQLTPEQQARLRSLRGQLVAQAGEAASQQAGLKTRLEGKIKRIHAAVQQWQEGGRDPSAVGQIMQEFEPLMKLGKHKEAEAVLDRALSELGIGAAPKAGAQADPAPRPVSK